jgi:DNA (cytosine-5)-methyltransferase 3A
MNVLSLFDGCSGGQQALDRLGIKVDNYYASEIDKYAIQVTMANYPNTIQLGSVVDVDVSKLPKIDLLCGGSPCQSFSFAGKRKGMSTKDNIEVLTLEHYLQLRSQNFEFEGQSYLFWEYMRILSDIKKVNPDVKFLLENVMMGEKWQRILTQAIGINPIEINSALISAQNRRRLYWTNIGAKQDGFFGDLKCAITQPKDRGILLKDVLQDNPNPKYYISTKMEEHLSLRENVKIKNGQDKSGTITTNGEGKQGNNSTFICQEVDKKYYLSYKMTKNMVINNETKKIIGHSGTGGQKGNIHNIKGKSSSLCASDYKQAKQILVDNTLGVLLSKIEIKYKKEIEKSLLNDKCTTLDASYYKGFGVRSGACRQVAKNDSKIRRLTPIECERLQTVKDNYTAHVSDSQRYKMLGNGWTIEVIAHIFSFINK